MDQELDNTSNFTRSEQAERDTPKLLSLMKQIIALERQLCIVNNEAVQPTPPSKTSTSDPLEVQLSKLEARLIAIQEKQHHQNKLIDQMSFLVTRLEARVPSAKNFEVNLFHLQSEEYRRQTAEAIYDDED